MYIAICDDDSKIINGLKIDIYNIFKSLKAEVDVSVFVNGTELIDTIKKKRFIMIYSCWI